jgi:hypothetical protein
MKNLLTLCPLSASEAGGSDLLASVLNAPILKIEHF